jgi:hypothetical protein
MDIPIRLSHSTLQTLHTCERKFQLDKLLVTEVEREESEHMSFGKAFGAGVATYLVTQDANRAMFEMWLAYWPELETDKKSIARCTAALEVAIPKLDTILMDYEIVHFEGKPAVELSFRLDITDEYYFVGYIDAVLKNRYSGLHVVFECKTTGLALFDLSPLYQNSGQALGYSIGLDKIAGEKLTSYGVLYFVCQLGKDFTPKIQVFEWKKTLADRLNWFISLGLDVKHLVEMSSLGVYPKRGESCLQYNRPCKYFGVCALHSVDVPKVIEEDTIEYQFVYQLEDLVQDHLTRIVDITVTETTLLGA